jgi:hypothetical protein
MVIQSVINANNAIKECQQRRQCHHCQQFFQLPEPLFIVRIVGTVGILGIDLILWEADV